MKKGIVYYNNNYYTFLITKHLRIKISSKTLEEAKLKFNMLHSLYSFKEIQLYKIKFSEKEHKKIAEELLMQLMNTKRENRSTSMQRKRKEEMCSSIYKGVSFNKRANLFHSYISKYNKRYSLGYYKNEEEAALAYNIAASYIYGPFASLNNIEKQESENFKNKILEKIN